MRVIFFYFGASKNLKIVQRFLIVLTKYMVTKKALKSEFEEEGLKQLPWLQCEKNPLSCQN